MAEEIKKYGGYVQMSRETAMDYGIVPPDEAYLAQRAANAARYQTHKYQAAAKLQIAIPLLDAITDPVARLVLDLHKRDTYDRGDYHWVCFGCEMQGYEAEAPYWPCATVEAIAKHFGIDVPDSGYTYRPQDGSLDLPQ